MAIDKPTGNPRRGAGPNPDCDTCHGKGEIKLWGGSARSGRMIISPCPDCFQSTPQWTWMMDYCKKEGLSPANEKVWKKAELKYFKAHKEK